MKINNAIAATPTDKVTGYFTRIRHFQIAPPTIAPTTAPRVAPGISSPGHEVNFGIKQIAPTNMPASVDRKRPMPRNRLRNASMPSVYRPRSPRGYNVACAASFNSGFERSAWAWQWFASTWALIKHFCNRLSSSMSRTTVALGAGYRESQYRTGGRVSRVVFLPVELMDRAIRPAYWTRVSDFE
jgi:hypothetical protein